MEMESENQKIMRYNPSVNYGLTFEEVKSRFRDGLVNVDKGIATKSVSEIIKSNFFTLFNFINFILAIAILCVGSYRNLLFMGVVVCNIFIGVVQELKAKRTVDRLNLISSKSAKVIREGRKGQTKIEKIVLDDIIFFESGNQIVADSVIMEGSCEVNESLLTGEPDIIVKKVGDVLHSGSYVVSGNCIAKVEHVGEDNYASKLLKGSKYIKKTKSQIMTTLNKIIKIISVAIIPMGALLFYRQFVSSDYDIVAAVVNTAAALTGMIPEGLVLLISSILAVGVLRLSRHKVLVQDIYCIETLARVDTMCLDKTGTITEGTFDVHEVISQNGFSKRDIKNALVLLTSVLNDSNETFKALKRAFPPMKNSIVPDQVIPFSSEKKWSGASFGAKGSYIFGATEFIFGNNNFQKNDDIKSYFENYRVLALAHSDYELENGQIPKDVQLMAFILIKDRIRYNAEKTLNFFKRQGVDIKIISGDNPVTVSKIAERVDLNNADSYIDATTLKSDEEVKRAAVKYTIFGRVTPNQKQLIVKSLRENGRTVGMVGDGVNDVLAMKEADCSVAMASGSDIAMNVSHLVLLNSDFASMPRAVAEGRKAINNIQRSASLFLTKTIYSFILAILFFFIPAPYPFVPIQMTLISGITIGIPSFVLALEPNREKIHGNLFKNIVSKCLPAALTIVSSLMMCVGAYFLFNMSEQRYSTLTVVTTGIVGMMLIYRICMPFNKLRKVLLWSVVLLFFAGVIYFKDLLGLERLGIMNILAIASISIISKIIYDYISKFKLEKYVKVS